MKSFSTLITEGVTIPEFTHPHLKNPNDPTGRFWRTLDAANETGEKASRGTYTKAVKTAKELYALLVGMENDPELVKARDLVAEAVKIIEKASGDTVDEMGTNDIKSLKNLLFIIQGIDSYLNRKSFYKKAKVDIKSGYVPLRGRPKPDPKISYRMVVLLPAGDTISEGVAKDITKAIKSMGPLHADYVAGVEFNGDRSGFQILFSKTPGYKK